MDLQLLGPVEATIEGRPVRLGATKQRAVLAILGLHVNRTVSVDRMIEGLWGEDVPDTAPKMVQLYVSQLRRLVDSAEIVTHGRGYELRSAAVDVDRFEQLMAAGAPRDALALWRGDPLADVANEPFAAAEIRRLEELRVQAAEQAIDDDLAAGRHAEVIAELEALVAANPLRERLHAQRMLALYRAGRQADALAAYRDARRVLVEEIGVEPGAELRELHDAILNQEPRLDLPPARSVVPTVVRRAPRRRILAVVGALLLVGGVAAFAVSRWMETPSLARIDENAVGVIEPSSGRITTQFTVGRGPSAIAAGGGSIWVANAQDGTVTRLDDDRAVVISIGEHPAGLAFAGGSLWVVDSQEGKVAQVQATTNRVVQRISAGNAPSGIAAGFGALWVTSEVDRTLARIDAQTAQRTEIDLGSNPTAVAAGADAVWVTSEEGGIVFRVDPRTREVTESTGVGNGPVAVAVGEGAVWVVNRQDGTVSRIDPATASVTATVPVGRDPGAVAAGGGGVWVTSSSDRAITRIDPSTQKPVETIGIQNAPSAVAIADGSVWTAALARAGSHRGGTLRVELPRRFEFERVDVGKYDNGFAQVAGVVYDPLVAYRRKGASTFGTLVGGLAAAVPDSSPDGKSYVFKLRPGIRFADGEPVGPDDVLASFERLIKRHAPAYYGRIVGASECTEERCDLTKGIVGDARSRTVTIRLTEPDPEFLHNLAFYQTSVAPADHPFGSKTPPPGTGPYRIQRYSRNGVRLIRNPHFRVWSQDARPDGFIDEIVVRARDRDAIHDQVAAVERGAADVVLVEDGFEGPLSPSKLRALRARGRGQLFTNAIPALNYMSMNVRTPPFDDVRVRQAVNYAVDRRAYTELVGGSDLADATCQFVPPGFPNYAPECRYTLEPNPGGAYTAPDLARARRLIEQSRTAGMDVTVWTIPSHETTGEFFVSLLRRLGYRSTLRVHKDIGAYFQLIFDPRTRPQMALSAWGADTGAPSQFAGLYTCDWPGSLTGYCDRGFETRVDAALAARGPEAGARWKEAYSYLAEAAPAVPLVNHRTVVFVSDRVGNYEQHPSWLSLLDRLWVR